MTSKDILDSEIEQCRKPYNVLSEELMEARREIEVLKLTSDASNIEWETSTLGQTSPTDDTNTVDLALQLQMSKLQLKESQDAQDFASRRLADYINLVKQSQERVSQAEHERSAMGLLVQGWKAREEAAEAERLRLSRCLEEAETEKNFIMNELTRLKGNREVERDGLDAYKATRWSPLITTPLLGSCSTPSLPSLSSLTSVASTIPDSKELALNLNKVAPIKLLDYPIPADMREARNQILSSLPIPDTAPSDALEPFIIPPPYTLSDFLGAATGYWASILQSYHVFQDATTFWCSNIEEHGYLLSPLYKCITNPKMPIIHKWYECEPLGILRNPTNCFYNKDEKWYYAGKYCGIPLANITPKEWDELSKEAKSSLLKETLSGRRNISPQIIYETGQLHSAGALKVSCVGLQCVGFDQQLYQTILTQAKKAQTTGMWKASWDVQDGLGISDPSISV